MDVRDPFLEELQSLVAASSQTSWRTPQPCGAVAQSLLKSGIRNDSAQPHDQRAKSMSAFSRSLSS